MRGREVEREVSKLYSCPDPGRTGLPSVTGIENKNIQTPPDLRTSNLFPRFVTCDNL